MQFFIHCNFFCQEYKFTFTLLYFLDPGPREIGYGLTWALWSTDKSSWEGKSGGLSEGTFGPAGDSEKDSFSSLNSEPEPESEPGLDPLLKKNPPP